MNECKFLYPGTLCTNPQLVLQSNCIVHLSASDVLANTMQL